MDLFTHAGTKTNQGRLAWEMVGFWNIVAPRGRLIIVFRGKERGLVRTAGTPGETIPASVMCLSNFLDNNELY